MRADSFWSECPDSTDSQKRASVGALELADRDAARGRGGVPEVLHARGLAAHGREQRADARRRAAGSGSRARRARPRPPRSARARSRTARRAGSPSCRRSDRASSSAVRSPRRRRGRSRRAPAPRRPRRAAPRTRSTTAVERRPPRRAASLASSSPTTGSRGSARSSSAQMIACEAKSATVTGLLSPFSSASARTRRSLHGAARARRRAHGRDRRREVPAAIAHDLRPPTRPAAGARSMQGEPRRCPPTPPWRTP